MSDNPNLPKETPETFQPEVEPLTDEKIERLSKVTRATIAAARANAALYPELAAFLNATEGSNG